MAQLGCHGASCQEKVKIESSCHACKNGEETMRVAVGVARGRRAARTQIVRDKAGSIGREGELRAARLARDGEKRTWNFPVLWSRKETKKKKKKRKRISPRQESEG